MAHAQQLYHIHPLSEQQLLQTYTDLLHDACLSADHDWKSTSSNPPQGYWGEGFSGEHGGIRPLAAMVMACGTILEYDDNITASEREDLFNKTTAAIRFATATHFTGPQKCLDGKHWGGLDRPGHAWQSSYWASSLAAGAWLIWDKLDPQLQKDVERVVVAQDDLLATGNPPTNLWGDTKAEENSWNVPLLVLGELMFPTHPHAALWHKTAQKYMMNVLSTEADTHDTTLVDGRAVKDWVLGANIQPDFTLENHNIFHPCYVACSSYFLTDAAILYTRAGQPTPQAANHHLTDVWKMFRTLILPTGESAYPQGMDWDLHGLPFVTLYSVLATRDHDAFASRMEQISLQYMREWQLMCHGSLTLPGSSAGFGRHAINCDLLAYAFLAHKTFGPSAKPLTDHEATAQEQGVHEYPYVQFIEHRTPQKFVSMSWKNRIMALVMPIQHHEENPEFSVPMNGGIVGSFDLSPKGDVKTTVVEHSWQKTADGFETTGTLLLNGGRLKQTLRLISLGNQTVIYEDRATAMTDITVQSEHGLPIGIENDSLTGGTRLLSHRDGQIKFDWQSPQKPTTIPGSWTNIDGRLGLVSLSGSGITYSQASKYSPGIAVYTDILYGSYSDHPRQFRKGDEVARRVNVFFVEVSPEKTASLAKSCTIETKPDRQVLHFTEPDGKDVEVPLH